MTEPFKILFQDEHYVAVDKPENLLVHRSSMSNDRRFLMQELRNQLDQHVFPVHRLDRPTSGVIVMALSSEAAKRLHELFFNHEVYKVYWALVRGWVDPSGVIDATIKENKDSTPQDAITEYKCLDQVELPVAVDKYPTSQYSLIEAYPKTGRYHQIRKHFARIFHPLVGDVKHGASVHNRYFRETYDWHRLALRAKAIEFVHPFNGKKIQIDAGLDDGFTSLLKNMKFSKYS